MVLRYYLIMGYLVTSVYMEWTRYVCMDWDWICKMDNVTEYLAFGLIAHLEYMI